MAQAASYSQTSRPPGASHRSAYARARSGSRWKRPTARGEDHVEAARPELERLERHHEELGAAGGDVLRVAPPRRGDHLRRAVDRRAAEALERPLRPGFVAVWFEGEDASAATMAERLVFTLEVWVAAMAGQSFPERRSGRLLERLDRVGPAFERIAHSVQERGAWNDAFVDALCEPPQSFTYGGVLAHIAHHGAIRTHALAGVLTELGADVSHGDPADFGAGG